MYIFMNHPNATKPPESLQHGSLGRGIRDMNSKELFINLLFDLVFIIQVVDIVQVDMLGICAVWLMPSIGPFSAFSLMCLLGFASTWLVSQVGGRLLRPICE